MIKPRIILAGAVALVALLFLGAAALGSGGSGFEIDWWTADSGGGVVSGAGYTLYGSIGQPDAGAATGSGGHYLQGGFWAIPGGTATPTATATPSPTPTYTNTPPATATSTPSPTATNTASPTATSTATPSPGPSPTATETETATATATPTDTATPGPSPTPTVTADYSAYIPMIIR